MAELTKENETLKRAHDQAALVVENAARANLEALQEKHEANLNSIRGLLKVARPS